MYLVGLFYCAFLMVKEYEQLQMISSFDLTQNSVSGVVNLSSMVVPPSLITGMIKAQ